MANALPPSLRRLASMALATLAVAACATHEPTAVVQVASQRLTCPNDGTHVGLNRETPRVREWIVGCNFTYTRVHCTDTECHLALARPACLDNGRTCFEEDPVTLEWVLDTRDRLVSR